MRTTLSMKGSGTSRRSDCSRLRLRLATTLIVSSQSPPATPLPLVKLRQHVKAEQTTEENSVKKYEHEQGIMDCWQQGSCRQISSKGTTRGPACVCSVHQDEAHGGQTDEDRVRSPVGRQTDQGQALKHSRHELASFEGIKSSALWPRRRAKRTTILNPQGLWFFQLFGEIGGPGRSEGSWKTPTIAPNSVEHVKLDEPERPRVMDDTQLCPNCYHVRQ